MRPETTSFQIVEDDRPPERTLVLGVIDGEKPLSALGNVDHRLLKGENNCRVLMERNSGLWYFKLDIGGLPQPLKDIRFTSFNKAKEHAEAYYKTRNIEITDVKKS